MQLSAQMKHTTSMSHFEQNMNDASKDMKMMHIFEHDAQIL